MAYQLRFNFDIPQSHLDRMLISIPLVFVVRVVSFFLLKTYAGIIYHTSVEDAKKIFIAITLGSLVFIGSNFISYPISGKYIFSRSVIIIDYVLAIFLMTAFRVFVKTLYLTVKDSTRERQNVLIYGIGESAIATKRSLNRDNQFNNKVVAFIESEKKLVNKQIEGVPIIHEGQLSRFLTEHKVDKLIFTKEILPHQRKRISDICLKYKIELLRTPPMDQWIGSELSFKQIKKVKIEDLLQRDPIDLDKANISKQVENKVILITGAAGSIGSEITRQLINFKPQKLILLDQAETPLYELEQELKGKLKYEAFEIVVADVRNRERMRNVFNAFRPEYVYHAAAYKHVPMMEENPSEAILTNVLGTKVVAELSSEFTVAKMVYVSTDKAVNPTNIMGASKRIGEIFVQSLNSEGERNTKYITTRFGNVLGSNGSVIPLFRKQIEEGGPITVTHKDVKRYFMTIPEACQLVLEAAAMGEGGEIFMFDMGEQIKIADLAQKMIELSGLEPSKDIEIEYTGLRAGEKLEEELLNDQENNLPTHHAKILIAKVREYNFAEIDKVVNELIALFGKQDNDVIVKLMKEIVPEFKSQNSRYQALDKV